MYTFEPVGIVKNDCDQIANHNLIKGRVSSITVFEKYSEGLLNIESCEFIDIVFYFHKSEEINLNGKLFNVEKRGVFASRSPNRPNSIGITTVKLISRSGNELLVTGLDAINGTPVLDIKSCDTSLFASESETRQVHDSILKSNPRIEIWNNISTGKTENLLLKAGQLHGHFCPGLAMGVIAATFAMQQIKFDSDGMEDLLAIVETNNCFSDGVQFVTGCSFGNNSLIYRDLGKTAITLTKRDGKGIRIVSLHKSRDYINANFPEFNESYTKVVVNQDHVENEMEEFKKLAIDRAFATLKLDFDKLFKVTQVNIEIPDYAPICESLVCKICGESVMSTRTVVVNGEHVCLFCGDGKYHVLEGRGITIKN